MSLCVTFVVLVFFSEKTLCGVWLCVLPIYFLLFFGGGVVTCVVVSVTYIFLLFFGEAKENGSAY